MARSDHERNVFTELRDRRPSTLSEFLAWLNELRAALREAMLERPGYLPQGIKPLLYQCVKMVNPLADRVGIPLGMLPNDPFAVRATPESVHRYLHACSAVCNEASGEPKRPARNPRRQASRDKLVAGLTAHHQYENGSCLNLEPIGNNELAKRANVSHSTASYFFQSEFGGYDRYVVACQRKFSLINCLKVLNGEVSPGCLLGEAAAQIPAPDDEE